MPELTDRDLDAAIQRRALEILGYPPDAMVCARLYERLEAEFKDGVAVEAALNSLLASYQIGVGNNWAWKERPPMRGLTKDDADWLRGEGRHAQ